MFEASEMVGSPQPQGGMALRAGHPAVALREVPQEEGGASGDHRQVPFLRLVDAGRCGGFHKGYPFIAGWFGKTPKLKWMIFRGTPMDWKTVHVVENARNSWMRVTQCYSAND